MSYNYNLPDVLYVQLNVLFNITYTKTIHLYVGY